MSLSPCARGGSKHAHRHAERVGQKKTHTDACIMCSGGARGPKTRSYPCRGELLARLAKNPFQLGWSWDRRAHWTHPGHILEIFSLQLPYLLPQLTSSPGLQIICLCGPGLPHVLLLRIRTPGSMPLLHTSMREGTFPTRPLGFSLTYIPILSHFPTLSQTRPGWAPKAAPDYFF